VSLQRLSDEEMVQIRKIRLEYRIAVVLLRNTGLLEHRETFNEIKERRDRVIRSLSDDEFTNKQIGSILGISKNTVEAALNVRAMQE
jgi:DNA-directed RNA polymerase specialized sigma subunit